MHARRVRWRRCKRVVHAGQGRRQRIERSRTSAWVGRSACGNACAHRLWCLRRVKWWGARTTGRFGAMGIVVSLPEPLDCEPIDLNYMGRVPMTIPVICIVLSRSSSYWHGFGQTASQIATRDVPGASSRLGFGRFSVFLEQFSEKPFTMQ